MENPESVYEKVDAAANLVEQMFMAYQINDKKHFEKVHKKAGDLLFKAMRQLEELEELENRRLKPIK